jgi:hypothetical protein
MDAEVHLHIEDYKPICMVRPRYHLVSIPNSQYHWSAIEEPARVAKQLEEQQLEQQEEQQPKQQEEQQPSQGPQLALRTCEKPTFEKVQLTYRYPYSLQ